MKKFITTLTLAVLGWGAVSCVDDAVHPAGNGAAVSFKVSTPRAPMLVTRAIASQFEWNVATLDLYAAEAGVVTKLTEDDYTISPALSSQPNQTYTVTLNESWLNPRGGETVNFYIVANDTSSTNGPHTSLVSNLADEDDFKSALSNALTQTGTAGLNPIAAPNGGSQNLLFSADMQSVLIAGRVQETCQLRRREARFDIQNQTAAAGPDQLVITGIRVVNAPDAGLIFGVGDAATPGIDRSREIRYPGLVEADYDATAPGSDIANDLATSVFYLYPTTLVSPEPSNPPVGKTQILVEGTYHGNTVIYPVNVAFDTPIQANFRYILNIDATSGTIELGGDEYEEGGTLSTGPAANTVKATIVPETTMIMNLTDNVVTTTAATYTTRDANVFAAVDPAKTVSMPFTVTSEAGTTYVLEPANTEVRINKTRVTESVTRAGATRADVVTKEVYTVKIPAGVGFLDATLTIDSGGNLGTETFMIRRLWGGDASAILYFDINNTDPVLTAGSWDEIVAAGAQGRMAMFKQGGVIGADDVTTFGAAAIKFNPSSTYKYPAEIPYVTWAEVDSGILNTSDPAYHNVANIRAGKGDPCKLVGLRPSEVILMSDAQLAAYESGWRLPTVYENLAFVGGPADAFPLTEMTAGQFWKAWKIGGVPFVYATTGSTIDANTVNESHLYAYQTTGAANVTNPYLLKFPVETSYVPAFSQKLPEIGYRGWDNGAIPQSVVGVRAVYISSTPVDRSIPVVGAIDYPHAYILHGPSATAVATTFYNTNLFTHRCVSSGKSRTVVPTIADPVVGGVTWAKYNLVGNRTFEVGHTSHSGFFFQWGESTPWFYNGTQGSMDGSGKTWTDVPKGDGVSTWPDAKNPCPVGYRVPTSEELAVLADGTKVTSTWIANGGTSPVTNLAYRNNGREFVDKTTGDVMYLAAYGWRDHVAGAYSSNQNGNYWSNKQTADGLYGYYLNFNSTSMTPNNTSNGYLGNGYLIRCVAE
ncbi:MAG: fibrobacter succinogenes major paralogous domain-containing protein [Alistipes sp.]|jgi:uncharacterized protein (TIGR02145 family)|nr:fibrobacter succinogenes major paralogous domain-containing protein [Alistipes sp.]